MLNENTNTLYLERSHHIVGVLPEWKWHFVKVNCWLWRSMIATSSIVWFSVQNGRAMRYEMYIRHLQIISLWILNVILLPVPFLCHLLGIMHGQRDIIQTGCCLFVVFFTFRLPNWWHSIQLIWNHFSYFQWWPTMKESNEWLNGDTKMNANDFLPFVLFSYFVYKTKIVYSYITRMSLLNVNIFVTNWSPLAQGYLPIYILFICFVFFFVIFIFILYSFRFY